MPAQGEGRMSASASEPTAQPSEGQRGSAEGTLENGVALLGSVFIPYSCLKPQGCQLFEISF